MICLPGHPASAGGTMSGSAFVCGVNALFERAPIEHAAEAPFRFPARRLHQEHSLICARRGGFRSRAGIPFQAQITGGVR